MPLLLCLAFSWVIVKALEETWGYTKGVGSDAGKAIRSKLDEAVQKRKKDWRLGPKDGRFWAWLATGATWVGWNAARHGIGATKAAFRGGRKGFKEARERYDAGKTLRKEMKAQGRKRVRVDWSKIFDVLDTAAEKAEKVGEKINDWADQREAAKAGIADGGPDTPPTGPEPVSATAEHTEANGSPRVIDLEGRNIDPATGWAQAQRQASLLENPDFQAALAEGRETIHPDHAYAAALRAGQAEFIASLAQKRDDQDATDSPFTQRLGIAVNEDPVEADIVDDPNPPVPALEAVTPTNGELMTTPTTTTPATTTGEATSINQARIALQQIRSLLEIEQANVEACEATVKATVDNLKHGAAAVENLINSLGAMRLDPETMGEAWLILDALGVTVGAGESLEGDAKALMESVNLTVAATDTTHTGMNTRHRMLEEAHAATPHAALEEFYRGD